MSGAMPTIGNVGERSVVRNTPPGSVSIADAMDNGGWNSFRLRVVGIVLATFLIDGVAQMALGLTIPSLMAAWRLPISAFSTVMAANWIGGGVGALLGGLLSDRIGRRPVLVCSVLLFGAATCAASLATGPAMLAIILLAAGLGIGGCNPPGLILAADFAPAGQRHRCVALAVASVMIGATASGFFAASALTQIGWSAFYLVVGILALVFGVGLWLILPESPRFLAQRGGPRADAVIARILAKMGSSVSSGAIFATETVSSAASPLSALFRNGVWKMTVALWVAFFTNVIAAGLGLGWLPTMMSSEGYSPAIASLAPSAWSIGGIIGSVLISWLLNRVHALSAAPLLGLCGLVVAALSLSGLFQYLERFGMLPLLLPGLFGMLVAAQASCFFVLSATLYPSEAASTSVGSATTISRLGAVCSSFVGAAAISAGGAQGFFLALAVAITISLVGASLIRFRLKTL